MSRYTYGASRAAATSRSRVVALEALLRAAEERDKASLARATKDASRIRSLEASLSRATRDRDASRARVKELTTACEQHKADIARIREDAARIRSLEASLIRTTRDLDAARARVEALTISLKDERGRAGHTNKKAKKPTKKAADRPRFTAAEMRRRPGNPQGEARLMKAAAEAFRHGTRKEAV